MSAHPHPWTLTAPWYRWTQPGVPGTGRGSAPVLQKYADDDFVSAFLAEPQRCLQWQAAIDQVHEVDYRAATLAETSSLAGKVSSLFPLDAQGRLKPMRTSLRATGLRKVYLDAHSRHYLVVCELHCDVAGFPCPSPREVCQAGFVVRRRSLAVAAEARGEAERIVRELTAVQAALRSVRPATAHDQPRRLNARVRSLFGGARPDAAALALKRAELQHELHRWKTTTGASFVREGWLSGAQERIGQWAVVEDEPQDLQEPWFRMWPLVPDPQDARHDGRYGTLFFGVLPTGSADTDAHGRARFDSRTSYELRCFVRRHDARCPRGDAPDCHGELVWSLPTETFRLAAPFDLQGTSQRPVTIQMPDLAELAAQAAQKPIGTYSPVKVVQPQSLVPSIDGTALSGGSMKGGQICFISIPLITIVALFVFNLFLPVVVFLFGLWFLLAFKLCIPPSISLDADLDLQLQASPPRLDVEFDIDVEVSTGTKRVTTTSLNDDLTAGVAAGIEQGSGLLPGSVAPKLADFPDQRDADGQLLRSGLSNEPLGQLHSALADVAKLPSDIADDPPVRGDITAGLVYFPRVEHPRALRHG